MTLGSAEQTLSQLGLQIIMLFNYKPNGYGVFTLSDTKNDLCSETNEMAKSSQ